MIYAMSIPTDHLEVNEDNRVPSMMTMEQGLLRFQNDSSFDNAPPPGNNVFSAPTPSYNGWSNGNNSFFGGMLDPHQKQQGDSQDMNHDFKMMQYQMQMQHNQQQLNSMNYSNQQLEPHTGSSLSNALLVPSGPASNAVQPMPQQHQSNEHNVNPTGMYFPTLGDQQKVQTSSNTSAASAPSANMVHPMYFPQDPRFTMTQTQFLTLQKYQQDHHQPALSQQEHQPEHANEASQHLRLGASAGQGAHASQIGGSAPMNAGLGGMPSNINNGAMSQLPCGGEFSLPSPHTLFHRDGSRRMRGGVIEPFPEKLHRLLTEMEAAGRHDVISFVAGGQAFGIHKPDKFFKEIVPLYFRQSRLSSFKRQLNLYGFELINTGPARGGYFHDLFVKERPELCRRMRRVAVKMTPSVAGASGGKFDNKSAEKREQGSKNNGDDCQGNSSKQDDDTSPHNEPEEA